MVVCHAIVVRYWARPALSLERLRETKDGRYAYELKYPSLGRTHLVLTPTELLARLSLLVAPPRYPLVRYGGAVCTGASVEGLTQSHRGASAGAAARGGMLLGKRRRRAGRGRSGEGGESRESGADAEPRA